MESYLLGPLIGVLLYWIVKEAVAAGVKEALTDAMTSGDAALFLSEAVSSGIEQHRQDREDAHIDIGEAMGKSRDRTFPVAQR